MNASRVRRIFAVLGLALAPLGASLAAPPAAVSGISGPWAEASERRLADERLLAQSAAAPRASLREEPARWMGANDLHKVLGLGSLGAAGLTFLSPKSETGAHPFFARSAVALGLGAVATGLYAHWDDVDANWRDPDTQHAVLGALGVLGYMAAVAQGGKGSHAAYGGLGAASMALAIKLTW